MDKKCILVIEDESAIRTNVAQNLEKQGFEVFAFDTAEKVLESDLLSLADAVIMDIRLPGMNGWDATALVKKSNADLPVLILTAYSDLESRVQGFETGADDYIIKPFFIEELIARVKTVLKRYEMLPGTKKFYKIEDLYIDMKRKTVYRNELPVKLSLTEFKLLVLLAEEHGVPVSKEEIHKRIWKGRYSVGDNTIEVYINLLRNKIDKNFAKKLIQTKTGFGYYLLKD